MQEAELKYLLHLLDELTEDVFEELMKIHYEMEESKSSKDLSETALTFLKESLKCNPVTTSTILSYFQTNTKSELNVSKIESLYLEVLSDEISKSNNVDKIIALISLLKLKEESLAVFTKKILKSVADEKFKQHRKQILLSLMPQQHPELLKVAAEEMHATEPRKVYKLTPEYMLELLYQGQTHWLLKAASVYKQQLHDMKKVTFNINNFTKQILIMVLIELTNSPETYDLPSLVNQLRNTLSILDTYVTADEHLQYYMTEVKRELTIIKFCLENNCKIMTTSVFSQLLTQSALAVISQLCQLSKVDRYKVSRLLNANNDTLNEMMCLNKKCNVKPGQQLGINWDILTYNSYCAITKIIDSIMSSSDNSGDGQDIGASLEDIKRLILSIQPVQYSIEVIENLFSCLFLRYEYFSCDEHNQDVACGAHSDCSYFYSKKQNKTQNSSKTSSAGFMCKSLTTQIILNTLKGCLESIEEKLTDDMTESAVAIKFKHLTQVVNHAIWKLQLVSTLSPDTGPLQVKLCLDYVEVAESSDDEAQEVELRVSRRKNRSRRKNSNMKHSGDQMISSTISANGDGYVSSQGGGSIDFIALMLAKPNCLVALALYHNDFPKANQIIEMFDLSDAEIATEVTFTEQLRHLVAKIKNIIYYKDNTRYPAKELSKLSVVSTEVMSLVEGFLASNRAPNSFDIIELATRHPHLQLYSHQNAPFMNAVDILLSSALNREITYGLINVVERKLAEVRSCTDVAAVKKTNYIRFVEDIASVTFEIFGNTEKAFHFVDNACELIADCRIPIKHKEFCKLNQLSKDLRKSCEELADVVAMKDQTELDAGLLQKYHQIYMNVVAASDKDVCNIAEVCPTKRTRTHYLRMCYIYCKTVSQLEQGDNRSTDSNSEVPYFAILEKQLHDIFKNLINNKDMPVTSLEPICRKLNVNLIPKLILNFCPSIALASPYKEASESNFNNLLQAVYDFKNTEEHLFQDVTANLAPLQNAPEAQCLTYIVLHNWVLAHIIKKIHTSTDENSLQQSMDARTKFVNNYMDLERFNFLKVLFDNNKYLASLHTTINLDELFLYMPKLINTGKILKCLNIIDALSEHQLIASANLMNLRDLVLFKLALHPRVERNWAYCQHLRCPELKVDLILNNLSSWPLEGAMEVLDYLRFLLDPVVVDEGLYEKCNEWMTKIPLYDQIATIIGCSHWYDVYEKSAQAPEEIIDLLMGSQQFKLCLEWADSHEVSENMKNLITVNLLRQLFEYPEQATPARVRALLARLPTAQAVDLLQDEMTRVKSAQILQVCVDFVSENSSDYKSFENIRIGLQIMLEIDLGLRNIFWELIEKPLLMIEQFLMNAKIDVLSSIIGKIAPNLKKDPAGDNLYYNIKSIETLVISRNAVDALLRFYAEKALDMKNPRNSYSPPPKPAGDALMQSIDSINMEAASRPFVMPTEVPSKTEWVGDSSTDKCMLCKVSIFSMIIRRHHCRRCGRLICHACSRHRMQVQNYPPGVKFRVCDDCYTQTLNNKSSSDSGPALLSSASDSAHSGASRLDWCLSASATRNAAVRAEFSYEFTPNVTLCLTLMKMHTTNLDYPRFLLDRSDEMATDVPCSGDARMLVRARRSLLLAAAELYARLPTDNNAASARVAEAGALHAARCLAHADALATLVTHSAHHLMPPQGMHPSHIVRSLLEAEKWELALEIATKSGLSRTSVLAAWGKACLKAGCFQQARDKFAHCFKSAPQLSGCADAGEECEYGREAAEVPHFVNRRLQSLRHSRSSSLSSAHSGGGGAEGGAGRARDPPLLSELITLLEQINYPVSQQLLSRAEAIKSTNEKLTSMNASKKITLTEPALNIMHTLASLRKIKQGDYSDFQTAAQPPKKTLAQGLLRRNTHQSEPKPDHRQRLDPFFHRECVYYLSHYGSHGANIAFHMKHSPLPAVLQYCRDHLVDRETFTDAVYMECLKREKVDELLKCMADVDGTLELWGDYITHICRTLESTSRLDALYSLQCASHQHARAAATCARLYCRPVPRVGAAAALQARQQRLTAALHHLSHVVPATAKGSEPKTFHMHLDKTTIDKHMTTISRQIELAKYLAACEAAGRLTDKLVNEVIPVPLDDGKCSQVRPLTLFGSATDRVRLVSVVLVAGQTVEEGFNLAFRIITENKIDSMNMYTYVAQYLVQTDRFQEVKTLARCIRASRETAHSLMSDQVLETGVGAVVRRCEARGQLHDEQAETLIEDIHSVGIKISCYLSCRILSTAYILAARHDRLNDLRRVLHDAERLGNEQIRSACLKRLTSTKTHH